MGTLGARPLPPRLDPRAGRPPRPRTRTPDRSSADSVRRPAPSDPARSSVGRRSQDSALDHGAPAPGFGRTLGLTTLGALLPGTAFLAAGYRRLGWLLLAGLVLLVVGGPWLATAGQHIAVRPAVSPTGLLLIIAAAVGLAVVWALVVIAGYRVLAPGRRRRVASTWWAACSSSCSPSASPRPPSRRPTSPPSSATSSPACSATTSSRPPCPTAPPPTRGATRTASTCCCSAATAATAATASAPTRSSWRASTPRPARRRRSACRATSRSCPSPRTARCTTSTPTASGPAARARACSTPSTATARPSTPTSSGPTDNPGADFLKLGVGEALGLTIDYYVLVNLDGFSQLIDALGGITVNVNYYVPDRWRAVAGATCPTTTSRRVRTSTWTASGRCTTPAAGSG